MWIRDIGRAHRMAVALKAGTVGINTSRVIGYMMPFGCMKQSGLGRESGIDAIGDYLETMAVWTSTSDAAPATPS